jgi:hypothetical protein
MGNTKINKRDEEIHWMPNYRIKMRIYNKVNNNNKNKLRISNQMETCIKIINNNRRKIMLKSSNKMNNKIESNNINKQFKKNNTSKR